MSELVSLSLIERLTPGTAMLLAQSGGLKPSAADNSLLSLEVRPAPMADVLLDKISKHCDVNLVHKQMDGRTGWLILSAKNSSQLSAAADLVQSELGAPTQEIQVSDSPLVSALSQEHATQLNRQWKRVMVTRGDALLTIDCRPAVYALKIAVEAENQLMCQAAQVKFLGSSGRVVLTGQASSLQSWSSPL
ncbi:hypothetical protein [Vibrio sp. SCSIO 43136]|uniref:hypothetical protein n=1 Tax=Vibrio sp. SCSIO 43136 TaxID=2819101 RepID=UPI0020750414|nr:hypothetical protein [Vibrio sp. SCSIO 43136]USD66219.1 hypothetical protein J4N39_05225 [Vibrio sp. SCSIO 43136]